ncbi:hypothetical protein Tco_0031992 [Tanacetum coccineum]
MSIKSRQCPAKLFNVVKTLSDAQKKDVREMGFASILKLDIVVNPLKMGYWVVDRLNPETLCLEIDNKTALQITRQSVHDIFGFPMGNIKVEDITRADIRNNITREWRGQYPPAPKGDIQRLFYLDSTRSLPPNVEKLKPAIKFWNNEMLKKAEKDELDAGGFGTKEFSRDASQTDNENEIANDVRCGAQRDNSTDSDEGDAFQTENEDEIGNGDRRGAQLDNGDQFNPYEAQKSIQKAANVYLESLLARSLRDYPDNKEIQRLNRLEDEEELIIQLGREKFKKKQQTNNMNENETLNEASQEKWILTQTQTLDDLDLLSQLEKDVVSTLNTRNKSRKRRIGDFEGPSFVLGFSPLKSQKHEMKTNDLSDAK